MDDPRGAGLRQLFRAEAVGKGSFRLAETGRPAEGGRAAGGRVLRRARRAGSGGDDLAHPGIAAISFVGSTAIAETIYRGGTFHGKRVQALGGAKNHLVVMPDADIDDAVDALMGSADGAAGERCMAVSVAVTVGSAGDALMSKLAPRVRALKVAPGVDPEAEMGPLVTREHLQKVRGYVDLGVRRGRTCGRRPRVEAAGLRERVLPRRLPVRQRGTGNFHAKNARLYEDFGLFTTGHRHARRSPACSTH